MMLLLHKENHSAVYALSDEYELFYAPVYQDNTVNLSEFAPVDLAEYDDVEEIENIQSQLISACVRV